MHRRTLGLWRHFALALMTVGALLTYGTAQANIIAYDGISYPPGTALDGQNGGFGWADAYSTASGGPVTANIIAGSIPVPGLATSGDAIETASAATGQTDNQRPLITSVGADGTTVFLSFLIRPTEAVNSGSHGSYGGFALGNLFVGKLESGFYGLSNFDGTGAVSSTVAPVLNTTALLVVRFTFQSGADKVDLFIGPNPNQPLPSTPDATKTDLDLGSVTSIDILADHAFAMDEFRIGDTFNDVTPTALSNSSTLVFQSMTNYHVGIWTMQGSAVANSFLILPEPEPGWNVVGTGDFNQDGKPDLLLQNQTTRQIVIWYMNGPYYIGGDLVTPVPDAGFQISGVADMDGDGQLDLILQNQTTGEVVIWLMSGPSYLGGVVMPQTSDPALKMVGTGDFDFNGTSDLLFQNQTTGEIVVWYMDRTVFDSSATLTTVPDPGWQVVSVADFNNDGRPDLVFQNTTTSQLAFWYLSGFQFIGGDVIQPIPDPDYRVAGPR